MRYTCDAEQPVSPPLVFSDVPENAVSLVLIVEDPDVPNAIRSDQMFDHWILFNISPSTTGIKEGSTVGMAGNNTRGVPVYAPPCPPPEHVPTRHRYVFRLFALDVELAVPRGSAKPLVMQAMQGHVLAEASLIGTYERS